MGLELVGEPIVIGLNQEWLNEWIDYRRQDCKKPMSDRAIRMVKKKLLQWSEVEQERLICLAIENEWQGIYYKEPQPGPSSRQRSIEDDLNDKSWARGSA